VKSALRRVRNAVHAGLPWFGGFVLLAVTTRVLDRVFAEFFPEPWGIVLLPLFLAGFFSYFGFFYVVFRGLFAPDGAPSRLVGGAVGIAAAIAAVGPVSVDWGFPADKAVLMVGICLLFAVIGMREPLATQGRQHGATAHAG